MNQVNVGSDKGLSPIRRQAIIWTNAGLLSIAPLGTNFSEILTKTQNFSFTIMHLKILSVKRRPFCPGKAELIRNDPVHCWMYLSPGWEESQSLSYLTFSRQASCPESRKCMQNNLLYNVFVTNWESLSCYFDNHSLLQKFKLQQSFMKLQLKGPPNFTVP